MKVEELILKIRKIKKTSNIISGYMDEENRTTDSLKELEEVLPDAETFLDEYEDYLLAKDVKMT